MNIHTLPIRGAFLAVALLYASTGQAGASGYIAVMALVGYEPDSIKPTTLVLNILVFLFASWRFIRDRHLDWELFWPFALSPVPMALLGGYITLQKAGFDYLLGALLLIAGTPSLARRQLNDQTVRPPPKFVALAWGATIGMASGLNGVGGGVLITPLLLFCRWSSVRTAACAVHPLQLHRGAVRQLERHKLSSTWDWSVGVDGARGKLVRGPSWQDNGTSLQPGESTFMSPVILRTSRTNVVFEKSRSRDGSAYPPHVATVDATPEFWMRR